MAKKKKEIENPVNDTVGYNGSVVLKLTSKDRVLKTIKVKNMGTKYLFESIAFLLSGRQSSPVPKFMAIGGKSGPTSVDDTHLLDEIRRVYITDQLVKPYTDYLGTSTEQTYLGHRLILTATFPYTAIGGKVIKELGLFSSAQGDNLMARISLGQQAISVDLGMSLIVEWTILIQNSSISTINTAGGK